MQKHSSFQVYNASAGSGKTFTLVKEYLKVVLQSEDRFLFQRILAITFTNKAAAEMKERILANLQAFSKGKSTDILPKILEETTLDIELVKERSTQILVAILQNYAAFGITTIDSFTHKIIKTFAHDLGLNLNFEVELDSTTLLNQAVDVLISKIGIENDITNALIEFSLEKANEDKSWDVSRDLNEFAKILLNEEDAKHFKKLSTKKISDFTALKKALTTSQRKIEKRFFDVGKKALELIEDSNVNHTAFSYAGECPKHFIKLKKIKQLKTDDLKFDGRLNTSFEQGKKLYAAKASAEIKDVIAGLTEELKSLYFESKEYYTQNYSRYILNKLALKSLIPLAVLTKINTELESIKNESNIRLIAEFNQLIAENIKDQPAPFIYERIGQKFMYYFIDEMQDTSVLQWQNLIPLIDNALSQEKSNLLLVGDGKQAIYRWRGGKADQFINLGLSEKNIANTNPFQIKKEVKELETNFRSYSEIIQFNNQFFQHVSKYFQNESYQQLFINGNNQIETTKKGGYVSIDFLEKEEEKEENNLKYAKRALEVILSLDAEFLRNEICILVRKKSHAIVMANYLSENDIEIVSSETLLLKNSEKVNFIINFLQVIQHPNDQEALLEVLYFLHKHLKIKKDKQVFFEELITIHNKQVFLKLSEYGVAFDTKTFYQFSFYDKIEEIIRKFKLTTTSDAYLQFFLDVVFDHQRKEASVQDFLDFWNLKKDTLSIVAQEASNAVQIMTIHKSKGLEFPVVIFPHDIDIYYQKDPKTWLSNLPSDPFNNFDELLIPSSKDIKSVSAEGAKIYEGQREELELDNFNLLYVALTRAIEQLYIVADKKINTKGIVNTNVSSGIFIEYLEKINKWNQETSRYSFGNLKRTSQLKKKNVNTKTQEYFTSTLWQDHDIYTVASASKLWDTEQGKAIEYGNLIHEMMAKILTKKEVKNTVNQYFQQGILDKERAISIEQHIYKIINHPDLAMFYSDDVVVFNEREIVTLDHQIIIPDRLILNQKNEVVIIDYKTGEPLKKHHQQLLKYEQVLKSMNFSVVKKLLIYIGETILVEEI